MCYHYTIGQFCAEAVGLEPTPQIPSGNSFQDCGSTNYAYTSRSHHSPYSNGANVITSTFLFVYEYKAKKSRICAEAVGLEPTLQVTPENRLAICCSTNYAYTSEMFGPLIHLCLHYSEENPGPVGLVGKGGLEPPISGVSDRRSNQLNYLPIVSHPGFEPGLLIILLPTKVSPVPSCLCFPIPLVAFDLRHVSWACVFLQLN